MRVNQKVLFVNYALVRSGRQKNMGFLMGQWINGYFDELAIVGALIGLAIWLGH